jgi:co-chaperonin GroES (HSP10)
MNLKFTPTGNRVLIEPIAPSEQQGRIVVLKHFQEKPSEHVVVAVPNKSERVKGECPVTVGQRVFINRYEGTEIQIENKMFRLVPWTDILASIE